MPVTTGGWCIVTIVGLTCCALSIFDKNTKVSPVKCPEEAEAYAKRLGDVLAGSWSNMTSIQPVDIPTILSSFKPRSFQLSEISEEYLSLRAIDEKPPRAVCCTECL